MRSRLVLSSRNFAGGYILQQDFAADRMSDKSYSQIDLIYTLLISVDSE
ncbi:MAG: hypothetical protein HC903_02915 [Methylacidiphilales bacterium]|nr:hypothetical protein [Candidatus Methylacidiphilales bacterium]NJR16000.1 hypothetical protein [Calothrix sp. CSU_2_0]